MKKYTVEMESNTVGFENYLKKVLADIKIEGAENLFSVDNKGLMLVSNHRSHLDYVMTGIRLNRIGFLNMRFAGGDNLTRLPILGKRFKALGTFSVFRGKASQRNYLFKLTDQVKRMMINEDNIVVYPEGGRSYSGRMMDMKGGIVGAAVMAAQEDKSKEYYYVPLACSYEVLYEANYFPILLKGKKFRDEGKNPPTRLLGHALYYGADIYAYLKMWFFPTNGIAHIDIGKPLNIRSITDLDGNFKEKAKNSFLANGRSIKEASALIHDTIQKLIRILPHNIAAYLLFKQIPANKIHETIEKLLAEMVEGGYNTKGLAEKTPEQIWEEGVSILKRNRACTGSSSSPKVKKPLLVKYFAGVIMDLRNED